MRLHGGGATIEREVRAMKRLSKVLVLLAVPCVVLAFPAAGGSSRASTGRILFIRDHLCPSSEYGPHDCGRGEIAVFRPDGSGLSVLTHNKVTELSPKWSPDGREIAYIRPNRPGGASQVWLMAADGTHQHALTRVKQGVFGEDTWPTIDWTPDGRHIVFVAYPSRDGGALQLYLANARTGATKLLLPVQIGVSSGADGPASSPDGRWIAYTSLTRHGPYRILLLSTRTVRPHRLTPGMAPAWSPDSRRIAFNGGRLSVINANGRHLRSLRVYGSSPSWSPDGKWIAFESTGGSEALAEIRPDGSGFHVIRRLTPGWVNIQPDWGAG
jgi:TolB protein